VCHLLIPFSIVGNDKQAFGLSIKAPYRGEPVIVKLFEIFHNRRETLVFAGGDTAEGLVEHIVVKGIRIFFLHSFSYSWTGFTLQP
jgi:hypothetical protein